MAFRITRLIVILVFSPEIIEAIDLRQKHGDYGVYLQAFSWEDIDTHYSNAMLYDELLGDEPSFRGNFTGVWLPPPSQSADKAGYMPGKWYEIKDSNKLLALNTALTSDNIVPIADIIVNHRTGATQDSCTEQYTNFEQPDWGSWAIVQNDMSCSGDRATCPSHCHCAPTGDTGSNFCGAPDIDHTNEQIQRDIITWLKWLRSEYKFTGWRFDMVRGFAPEYVRKYVEATNPEFAVGEFWHRSVDVTNDWATSANTRAFDFPLRYTLRDAINNNDYGGLQWVINPPGLMGVNKEMAVTFLDNHDTAGHGKEFTGSDWNKWPKLIQGYAYLLTHPGTPMVFYPHWRIPAIRKVVTRLIALRKKHKISSLSEIYIDTHRLGLYSAYIHGSPTSSSSRRRLAMKLGSDEWVPSGSSWKLAAHGEKWAVWEMEH